MALSLFNLLWFTAVQRAVPADELARMSSWDTLGSFVADPVGLALAGVPATLYAAAVLLVVVPIVSLAVPSIRNFSGDENTGAGPVAPVGGPAAGIL